MKSLATLLGITGLVAAAACGSQEEGRMDRTDEMMPSAEMQEMGADTMAADSMAADTMMDEGMPEEMLEGTAEDEMGGAGAGEV